MVSFEFYILAALVFIGGVISICVSYKVGEKSKLCNLVIARICDAKFNDLFTVMDKAFEENDELRKELDKLKDEVQSILPPEESEEFAFTAEEKEKFRKILERQAHG